MSQPHKDFDCVEMMHEGANHVCKQIEGMTREEELAFWQERMEALKKRQETLREQRKAS